MQGHYYRITFLVLRPFFSPFDKEIRSFSGFFCAPYLFFN
ncbi:hypothetical protein HMPREF9441_02469 [Paraprevotella clara YIT 11840]|uniref:Uncharacterized protein n=1 Tax=Paraprevotella clara YIT 11840 TaxID=762968 RepID=G5SSW9_9BACT|nr:hypothetical protein HMPREF9441_02469 [Paraprevotella clara YIT 11840]